MASMSTHYGYHGNSILISWNLLIVLSWTVSGWEVSGWEVGGRYANANVTR